MVRIRRQLVKINTKVGYLGTNSRKYITIHETDNFSKGANAAMHAKLQSNGNSRKAGWHWQVDDHEAVQSFAHTAQPWHAGSGTGNRQSIGIEICVNSDGNYKQAVANAAELVKKIMKEENIPLSNVVQHNHWSGKNCPRYLRSGSKGVNWNDFKNMIRRTPEKVDNSNASAGKPAGANVGGSIVDYLNSKKVDSSFTNRKKLAAEHGIANYKGTAEQNNKLLEAVKKNGIHPVKKKKYNMPTRVLKVTKPQMHGADVKEYQEALASLYFYPQKGAKNNGIDGYYGPKSEDATKRFQSMYGLAVDGHAGPATKHKLDSLVNK